MKRTIAIPLSLLISVSTIGLLPLPVSGADPILHNNYGVKLLEQGEVEKAIEQMEKAYSLFALDPVLKKNLATAYAIQGQKLLDHKAYAEAADQFGKAETLFPDEPRYALLRGIAFTLASNFTMGRHELEKARTLDGDTAEGLYFLGKIHYDSGETEQALVYWEKAAAIAPSDPFLSGMLERMRRENAVEARMGRGHSSRVIVSYDVGATATGIALSVLDALETAYNSVGADLGYFPETRIPVILYTQKDYREVTRSPHWSAGLYDGKIRLPVGGLTEITPDLRATLRHEYTHAVVRDLTKGNCPTWLNEGLAELQGRQEHNTPLVELVNAARGGEIFSLKGLEGSFASLEGRQVRLAYEQSYAVVNFMVAAYGWHRVRIILGNLGAGKQVADAITLGLADLGLDYDGVIGEWRQYLQRELSGMAQ
ncbi:MAG: tetratricopeptide repeat protein [Desulfuromonadales bacterium]|nr:MAG: tetratricopeptide repeat protein [Desulfuromonadales bacterium]